MESFFSAESMAEYIAFFERHYIMCAVWVVVLVLLIYTQVRILMARVKKVSSNAASLMVNHDGGIFVDVRSSALFSKAHIANSVNITLAEIKEGKIQRIDSAKDRPIILVGKDKFDSECFNGAVLLKKQGFSKVFSLDGGISQWAGDNLPLSDKK